MMVARIGELFSPEDLRQVEAAVKRAEARTSVEIVVFITAASDAYHLAAWKGAVLGGLLAALSAAVGFAMSPGWDVWIEAWLVMPVLFGGALGYLCGRGVTPIRRALVDAEVLDERVERRAAEVFLEEEVFATRDRSGILVFLSLFERRVVVLPDSGVRANAAPDVWKDIAADLAEEIREGHAADGLLSAVASCQEILSEHQMAIAPDDANELSDAPRVEEER